MTLGARNSTPEEGASVELSFPLGLAVVGGVVVGKSLGILQWSSSQHSTLQVIFKLCSLPPSTIALHTVSLWEVQFESAG